MSAKESKVAWSAHAERVARWPFAAVDEVMERFGKDLHQEVRAEDLPVSGAHLIEFVGGPMDGCFGHQSILTKMIAIPQEHFHDEAAALPRGGSRKATHFVYQVRIVDGVIVTNDSGRVLYDFQRFEV